MSKSEPIKLTPVEQAMTWERMTGQRLSYRERLRIMAGGEFVPPGSETTALPRPITHGLLNEFEKWTKEASMFVTAPEGAAFAVEVRAVIDLARIELSRTMFREG